jgi:hypothetical protein
VQDQRFRPELLPEAHLNVHNLMSFMQPLLQGFKQSNMANFTFEDSFCYGLGSGPDYGITAQRNKLWELEQHQPARFAFMMNLIVLNVKNPTTLKAHSWAMSLTLTLAAATGTWCSSTCTVGSAQASTLCLTLATVA